MPQFPGGQNELFKYLGTTTRYPPNARSKDIQGKVYINFTIAKDGAIEGVKVIRGVHPLLDEEAIRVVSSMPNWSPGKQDGEEVRVSYSLPINFMLHNSNSSDNRSKGLKYFNEGDYEKSIYYYSKIMKVKKNDIDLLYHRGMAYHKHGKTKKAIKDLTKAKELGSKPAEEYLKTIK